MRKIALVVGMAVTAGWGSPAQTARTLADLEPAIAKVAAFEYGESRDALYEVRDFIGGSLSDGSLLRQIESRLVTLLGSNATMGGKDFACRQLALIGTEASVPVLAGMVARPETVNMALYALTRIPGRAADEALATALTTASGPARVAVINAVGARRDTKSVPALSDLASSGDAAVAAAAVAALGGIGGAPALAALAEARAKTSGTMHVRASEAYIRCAARAETAAALKAYKEVLAVREPAAIHAAALAGIAGRAGKDAIPVLAANLASREPHVQAAAVRLLRSIPGAETTSIFLEQLPKLAPAGQVRVITALADRGDVTARPALVAAVNAGSAEVRSAALAGVGKVGDRSNLMLLAESAGTRAGAEQEAARESLYTVRGLDVDAAILAALNSTTGAVRAEFIRATGERAIEKAAEALLVMAGRDPDRGVRREALRALRNVGRQEHVPALLNLVLEARGASDRREAAQMLATVLRRSDTPQIEVLESAYKDAKSPEARAAVLGVMGQASWDQTLPLVRSALKDGDADVRRAAILALTEWVTPAPIEDLFEAAKSMPVPAHRVLALRGYLRLLGIQANRSTLESVRLVSEAIPLAAAPEEKKAILSLLTRYSSEESLVLVQKMLTDPEVATEAKFAVEWINTQLEFSRPLKYKR
jgi:HEAT repeat protein